MAKQQITHVLNMTVLDDSDFLSPYSETDTPVISQDVADFLENGANAAHPKDRLELNVHSNCIDDEEKKCYTSAIKNYFTLKLAAERRNLQRNGVVSLIFALIGIVGLAFMIICEQLLKWSSIWIEVLDIFAWVFIWEAVDQFFIERRKILSGLKRLQAFGEVPVKFLPLSERHKTAESSNQAQSGQA